ncbi:MAG TPA: hypothetical protein VN958_21830 [Chitinophagaceae bacterium]|nr:hypothetical protein [Chitinophagaceae bacterium]
MPDGNGSRSLKISSPKSLSNVITISLSEKAMDIISAFNEIKKFRVGDLLNQDSSDIIKVHLEWLYI